MKPDPCIEARVGAKWWADQIRQPPAWDNGDAMQSSFGTILAEKVREKNPISDEAIDRFEQILAEKMDAELAEGTTTYFFAMHFSTDYGPGVGLGEAADEAGLPPAFLFPWKTTMWAEKGRVWVGAGYGAEPVDLPLDDG